MADTVFNAHKPARELPISKTTGDLLIAVDRQLKHLPTDVRHTYGREYILLLLEMRRLVRKANAARTLEDKADRIAEFIDAYDDLAGFLVHTYSFNIRSRAWFLVDIETKTYLERPPWSFRKLRLLNQYKSITKLKNSYYAQSKNAKKRLGGASPHGGRVLHSCFARGEY